MKPLIVIPARGGSKGVKQKNIKLLNGKPLIYYTIEAARDVFDDSQIYVSTDDAEIQRVVEATGLKLPFLRPAHLATDFAGTYEVLLHAVAHAESIGYFPEMVVLLQPTSPFRRSWQIKKAIELYSSLDDMVVSVKETRSNPYYVLFEEDNNGFLQKSKNGNFIRRQDCPTVWEYNGAIYVINVASLKAKPINQFARVKKFVMNDISSHDIDTTLDWKIAELLINDGVDNS